MATPTVPFSELSRNSKQVAERLERLRRMRVTRRDGQDLCLTTLSYEREREETADVTARLLASLLVADDGARVIGRALPAVFPWVRHLSPEEVREFAGDLVDATHDAAQLDVHATLHRTIAEWRATARILADPSLTAELTRPLPGDDHGEVAAP